jgi:folate-binding protein YgfZ
MTSATLLRDQHQDEAEHAFGDRQPSSDSDRPGAATGSVASVPQPEYIPWGPPGGEGDLPCEILATLGSVEREYAHLRRHRGRVDESARATIRVEGEDAADFLDRMLTQKLAGFGSGDAAAAFLVDRKGRVQGELLLAGTAEGIFIDVDVHQVGHVVEVLDGFLFSEDVQLSDATEQWHRLSVHGPAASSLFEQLEDMRAATLSFDTRPVHVVRRDRIGSPGFELFVRNEDAVQVWSALDCGTVGWYAFNMARIEAGTPICNIDFGPGSLPHETTLVPGHVSFTKGCYPGQEIVARMEHLGQPSQILRGLQLQGDGLPVSGSQVMAIESDGSMGQPIGVVTSSALSPMLGSAPVAMAMLRTKKSEPGTLVRVHDEGNPCDAVTGTLVAWGGSEDVPA